MKHTGFITGIVAASFILTAGTAMAQGKGDGPGCGPRHERPAFSELDTDSSGEVTKEEMQAHRAARFAKADTDGDGKISLEEAKAAASKRASERAASMFERFDADGDGFLSAEEMPKPGRKGGLDKMFEHLDADESGGISEAEFKEAGDKMRDRHGKKGHGMKKGYGMNKGQGNCGPDKT